MTANNLKPSEEKNTYKFAECLLKLNERKMAYNKEHGGCKIYKRCLL